MPMVNIHQAVEAILEYPLEYIFIPRSHGRLSVPRNVFPPHLIDKAEAIMDQFSNNGRKIYIRDIVEPDLEFAAKYGRKSSFCLFNPNDRAVASKLIAMLMEGGDRNNDLENFIALAVYIRDRINPFLFQYAFGVAIHHKRRIYADLIKMPSVVSQFPENFIDPSILQDVKQEIKTRHSGRQKRAEHPRMSPAPCALPKNVHEVSVHFTGSGREKEQRMAYFREDIGVNMHHWHWHLVYPNNGPIEIVRKDRRGELFMYMHNQILARYNLDRFCNDLSKTLPLRNLREPIREGYLPKLLESVSSRTYPARMPKQKLQDMNRTDLLFAIGDLESWADRILNSIDRGFLLTPNEEKLVLDEKTGIDLLGNIIESSSLSVNPEFYGDLHNLGHLIIAFIHDPDLKYLEHHGVMGDITTAMRDPVFYRWHTFIDSFGKRHKAHLPAYGPDQLAFKDIVVEEIVAVCASKDSQPNVMRTFWQKSDVDIGVDLDFRRKPEDGYATFRFTHLQHEPFIYNIKVSNRSDSTSKGFCRIFLLPRDDERMDGLTLEEQRLMAVELDRFIVTLTPGLNHITRHSVDSSVTVPFTEIFKPQSRRHIRRDPDSECRKNLCKCGWPSHMLLPKGTAGGKIFKLFVMFSNILDPGLEEMPLYGYDYNRVGNAYSFCGLYDQRYPDDRSMGFPFDRKLPAYRLNGLVQKYSNMKSCDLNIVFHENYEMCVKEPKY